MNTELVQEYKNKIDPILALAKKANGSRRKTTPEHDASRQYTDLLIEFRSKGGSLPQLAVALGVAYSGIRRRVVMNDVSVETIKPTTRLLMNESDLLAAAQRVKSAKATSIRAYHDQLAIEYRAGVPLAVLARYLGLSGAAPLYYAVQRSMQRSAAYVGTKDDYSLV
jgi:hypothetical protein